MVRNIIVLKCGGSVLNELSSQFFANIVSLKKAGIQPIIVHGGGPAIKEMLDLLSIETEFVDGLRKTTKPVMDIVEMVLTGNINNALTRSLNEGGIDAVGLSGSDAALLVAKPKDIGRYGFVGEITDVNVSFLMQLLDLGIVPVIAPISLGNDGTRYNVNADTAAGAIAKAVSAEKLIFVTDVPGIMQEDVLLESLTKNEIDQLISSGVIHGGMLPKVKAAMASLSDELQEVMIVDGKDSSLSNDLSLVGTAIKKTAGVGSR